MGGLPILNAKNRQKVQNYRMRSERHELKRIQQERGSSPLPSTSAASDENPGFEVEILRECEGVLVCGGFYKERSYVGVMLTGDGPNGTPGPLVDEVTRFRSSVSSYQDSPKTDQWISALADRVSTNGIQLRKRNFMKIYGRMLCASCMMPVPENETIPRRHFIDPNQRRLLKKPRDQPRQHIVAQLNGASSRHSPHAHAQQRKQMEKGGADDMEVENGSNEGNETGPEASNDDSALGNLDGSEAVSLGPCTRQEMHRTVGPPVRANKRKAYKPREACNIVMPAGVDPFEPEYDFSTAFVCRESQRELLQKLPEHENTNTPTSPDTTTDDMANGNGQQPGSVSNDRANNTRTRATMLKEEGAVLKEGGGMLKNGVGIPAATRKSRLFSPEKFLCAVSSSSSNSNSGSGRFVSHASTIHFKSEKIRNAFLPSYRILETHSDGLHMKLVRQPSEEEHALSAATKKNHPKSSKIVLKCSSEQEAFSKPMLPSSSVDVTTVRKCSVSVAEAKHSSTLDLPTQCLFKKPYEVASQAPERCVGNEKMTFVVNNSTLIISKTTTSTSSIGIVKPEQLKKQAVKEGVYSESCSHPPHTDSKLLESGNAKAISSVPQCQKAVKIEEREETAASSQTPQQQKSRRKDKACCKDKLIASDYLTPCHSDSTAALCNKTIIMSDNLIDLPPCSSSVITPKHVMKSDKATSVAPCPHLASNHEQTTGMQSMRALTSVSNGDGIVKPAAAVPRSHPPIKLILKPVKNLAPPSPSIQSPPRDVTSSTIDSPSSDTRAKTFKSCSAKAYTSTKSATQSTPACNTATVKVENKEHVKQSKATKVVKINTELSSLKTKKEIFDESEEVEASEENVYGLKFGDVVWAKNGTDAFWPGRIHSFTRNEGKGGAAILWLGVATYSPFIDFTRLEPFVDCYANRFNPKRAEPTYHKAVACGIAACLPRKGYFEQKLSPQVHKVLISTHGFDPSEAVNIITRRKRRSAPMQPSHKKRKTTTKRNEGESSTSQENVEPVEVMNRRQEVKIEEDAADSAESCECRPGGEEPDLSDDEDRLIIACDDE
ncbi:unnamed protein product [Toxocara canis]|uniref:PWWP domain-containing protein n=1 Tax=Toxocara canis TaxID=6265 RepID=A0A183TV57_TOXCA|nr:unnamed protein product [Toxocara canis]